MIGQMQETVSLRDARAGDGTALQAIYGHHVLHGFGSFEEAPPAVEEMERRRAEVQDEGLPYLVAEAAGRVVGFAYAGRYRPALGLSLHGGGFGLCGAGGVAARRRRRGSWPR